MNVHRDYGEIFDPLASQLEVFLEHGRPTTFLPRRSEGARNIGICFLKPELCRAGPGICSTALNELHRRSRIAGFAVTALYGFGGAKLVARGVLNRIYRDVARNAEFDFCALTAPDRFAQIARALFGRAVPVRGGMALARSGMPPATLLKAWQIADEVRRVEPECYAAPVTLDDQKILLINGFYPYHVAQYTDKDARIILAVIETDQDLETLKSTFQGNAEPDRRAPDSFRGFLSDEIARSGYPALTTSLNGVHMSGSASEGRREVSVFSSYIQECGL